MTEQATGRCLCGAVTFTAAAPDEVNACHCAMCRRWAGGPWLAVHAEDVSLSSEENIATYRSSDWAERGFCRSCGTHLFYRVTATGLMVMSAGAFDDQSGFRLAAEIFTDEKPDWHGFISDDSARMTGAEVFAKFGGGT